MPHSSSVSVDPMFNKMSNAIRALTMDAVERANSGHPGMPMGIADVLTVLWSKFLRFDPENPTWPDRDRFVLSPGHASMALYALAYLCGYKAMTLEAIKSFRQLGSRAPGHPEVDPEIGVEVTTGPLGQGVSHAVGMALAERMLHARFGSDLVDHAIYAISSDGEMMEGVTHESASLAGHLKLGRLIVFYDDNKISIDGPTSLTFSEDVAARYRAYGWHVLSIDGHDPVAIEAATKEALAVTDKPSLIICRTVIGYGFPTIKGTSGAHSAPVKPEEFAAARVQLGIDYPPFAVPDDILSAWRKVGASRGAAFGAWKKRHDASSLRGAFDRAMLADASKECLDALTAAKHAFATEKPKLATRKCSGKVLEAIVPLFPEIVGGSADLAESNSAHVKGMVDVTPPEYKGNFMHYGVREHGMCALMGGLALHGGVVPYGGTFFVFSDYCRPSIRLAALMRQRVIYIMTHDSIGVGEDGPTHQAVEHLEAARIIPNLLVMRPCDGVEVAECWEIALREKKRPTLMALTRQAVPTVCGDRAENLSARGAYVLAGAEEARDITLLATGSEVSRAMEARTQLAALGIKAAVVSMPCFRLFEEQPEDYRAGVLGTALRLAVEAGVRQGWDRYIAGHGDFIGVSDFGISAPAEQVFKHFGVTTENVVEKAKAMLGK